MLTITIPPLLRAHTEGQAEVQLQMPPGEQWNVRQVLEQLSGRYPQLLPSLLYRDDLMPGIAVFVDNEQAMLGLRTKVSADSEILFAPPIVGG